MVNSEDLVDDSLSPPTPCPPPADPPEGTELESKLGLKLAKGKKWRDVEDLTGALVYQRRSRLIGNRRRDKSEENPRWRIRRAWEVSKPCATAGLLSLVSFSLKNTNISIRKAARSPLAICKVRSQRLPACLPGTISEDEIIRKVISFCD